MARKQPPARRPPSVGFVSLGCAKNLVDLQVMAGRIVRAGLRLAPSAEKADVILVNTCAFIESAREEAAENIVWACERKKAGKCRAVVVAGCLPQRYADRMAEAFPDVDAILGVDDLARAGEVVLAAVGGEVQECNVRRTKDKVQGAKSAPRASDVPPSGFLDAVSRAKPHRVFDPDEPGLVLSGGPFAYLKIAEGCFHACAFCAIPGIRGKFRSRPIESIVAEARALVADGYHELDLVAQDVTAYGRDFPAARPEVGPYRGCGLPAAAASLPTCAAAPLRGRPSLVTLLRELDAIPGDFRIRLRKIFCFLCEFRKNLFRLHFRRKLRCISYDFSGKHICREAKHQK